MLRLVHPETMRFLLTKANFQKVEVETWGDGEAASMMEAVGEALRRWEQERPGVVEVAEELLAPPFYLIRAWR